ncbi:hypothetical protein PIB30_020027 [Stylosanthes scabra]|uniref:Uncharacterized protein n=1 Tax=Stylosanthes scabra TaxID=79078 RepID=A0ABU6R8Q0_9FABA|nr:hypothetical protein [Stylosanthes scabra]
MNTGAGTILYQIESSSLAVFELHLAMTVWLGLGAVFGDRAMTETSKKLEGVAASFTVQEGVILYSRWNLGKGWELGRIFLGFG